jgi:hypothetical protein
VPDFPSPLADIVRVVDRYVVPVTMLWFVVRWFRLVPDDSNHAKALKATRQGSSAGIVGAGVVLVSFSFFCPARSSEAALSWKWASVALGLGAVAGLVTRFLAPERVGDDAHPWTRGIVVAVAIAIGLAAIILYYTYSERYLVHQWLMWAFMTLLLFYRLSFLIGE